MQSPVQFLTSTEKHIEYHHRDDYPKNIDTDKSNKLNGNGINYSPTWSSDGTYVAYLRISSLSHDESLIIQKIESGCKINIPIINCSHIDWSPDGNKIALVRGSKIETIDSSKLLQMMNFDCD